MPPSRLHPDEGAPRVGVLRRPDQARQGLRHGPAGRADRRLRRDGRPPRHGRQADVDRAQDPRRQEQGDLGPGPRPARWPAEGPRHAGRRGRHARRRRRADPPGDGRHHRDRLAREVAAGPRARRQAHRHERRGPEDGLAAQGHHHRRGGRGRRRVRQHVPRRRRQGDAARIPAADRPARGHRRQQGARAQLHEARHRRS